MTTAATPTPNTATTPPATFTQQLAAMFVEARESWPDPLRREVPFEELITLKLLLPEESSGIIVSNITGVKGILSRVEARVIRDFIRQIEARRQ